MTLFLSLAACIFDQTGACTEEARSSVNVHTTDGSEPMTAERVTYRIDGGEVQQAECMNAACTEWVAGWEREGHFLITAEYSVTWDTAGAPTCWYTGVAEVDVGRTDDGCHVASQSVTIAMTDEACE